MQPGLNPRLQTVADLVVSGRRVVDVGTDHGILAAWLYLRGVSDQITACDINEKPLVNAAKTFAQYGLTGKIALVRSDGLAALPAGQQEVVIAGMGGELIARILTAGVDRLSPDAGLVLQPMTHHEDLRVCLAGLGFVIRAETLVEDEGRLYLVLRAEPGDAAAPDDLTAFVGRFTDAADPLTRRYLTGRRAYAAARADGLRAENDPAAARFEALVRALDALLAKKEETS